VAGLAASFGSGAMTNSINEVEHAACIFAIGTNTTANHPIIGRRIDRALSKGAKLIVADPRQIPLCRKAHIWLRHQPGTDVALLKGMMRVVIEERLFDDSFIEERCEGFEAFEASIMGCDLATAAEITGVTAKEIAEAARMFALTSPATILYTMGITQHSHGTDNVRSVANLALVTGNIGKPSTGVNPLRGQNNVQGACDMGALPNVYPGYQKVDDKAVREKFEKAWGCDLNPSPGLTLTEIFEAAHAGTVKALYVMGENPLVTDPDSKFIEKAISRLELFVVQDLFLTDTARLADVVLPAASFAEKDGTFTNTERRVQRVRKAIEPVDNARPDWMIICDIARNMDAKGFDFDSPEQIMEEIRSLTPSYGGIKYERLEKSGLQWPCPFPIHPGTPYLYSDRFNTPSGRAQLAPVEYRPSAETASNEYPFILTTRRSIFHYHSVLSRKVPGLNALRSEEHVEINPVDAASLEIQDGEVVTVASRRGRVKAKAKITEVVPPGVASMTFHYGETRANILTSTALDPIAKIPEFKVCAVKIERVESAYISKDYLRWGTGEKR
jgi:formate dehydrogenase alpha subunit